MAKAKMAWRKYHVEMAAKARRSNESVINGVENNASKRNERAKIMKTGSWQNQMATKRRKRKSCAKIMAWRKWRAMAKWRASPPRRNAEMAENSSTMKSGMARKAAISVAEKRRSAKNNDVAAAKKRRRKP